MSTFSCLSKRKWTEREGHQRGECFDSFPSLDSPLSATKERAAAPSLETPRRRSPRRGDQRGEPRTVPFFVASRMGVPGEGKTKSLPPGVLSLFSTFSLHEQRENGIRLSLFGRAHRPDAPIGTSAIFPRRGKQWRAVEDAGPYGVTSNSSINSNLSLS